MEQKNSSSRSLFSDLFSSQREYNRIIRDEAPDKVQWTLTYLLGIHSEADEILRELNWKAHRKYLGAPVRANIAWELADLMKYVMSIGELWDFTADDLLQYTANKSRMLELQHAMDVILWIATGENIIVADLDGTLADWRKSFHIWFKVRQAEGQLMEDDPLTTMSYDVDASVAYPDYLVLKKQFEEEGGYGNLLPFRDAINAIREQMNNGAKLFVFTARPQSEHKRIWWDTYQWLCSQGIKPDVLKIGAEDRITHSYRLAKENQVVMFEDNPSLALRAANTGLKVYLRNMPYNREIKHPNIDRVYLFPTEHEYFHTETE